MKIETERLILREMTADDFDALHAVLADSDIMQHYPYTFDDDRVRRWIIRNMERYEKNGFGLWAVALKETGEMIGDCGITMQNIHGTMLPEIGYHIIPSQRTAMKNGMAFVEEYEDPDNTYTRVYVIHREEWRKQNETKGFGSVEV